MIFDTHAHYDDEAFEEDRDQLLTSLHEGGVGYIVNMGASMEGVRDSIALAERYPFIYAAVGIHPDSVGCLDDERMEELRRLSAHPKCVCIGEIGLDYHWDVEPHEVQIDRFIRQINLAKETGLPINVHSRNAAQDTFDVIAAEHAGTTGGIIHCYSGSREMAREYVKMGYSIGVGGVVTFKNGKTLKKVVEDTPIEYLVTETDCPYMAPEPFRGKRNTSGNIRYVIDEIARIKEMDPEETERILFQNALRIYGKII